MRKLFALVLIISISNQVFASVESEVEADRFQHKNGVLIDTWLNQIWQDQPDNINFADILDIVKISKKPGNDYKILTTSRYCDKLNLFGRNDWRLPTKDEMIHIYKVAGDRFRYLSGDYYWTSEIVGRPRVLIAAVNKYSNVSKSMWGYKKRVRCVSGKVLKRAEIIKTVEKAKREHIYMECKNSNDIRKLEYVVDNYQDMKRSYYQDIKNRLAGLYNKLFDEIKKKNNIAGYEWFIKTYPKAPQTKEALEGIYDEIKKKNNIAGYEWFIKTYPKAPQTKEALGNIYRLAFDEAKKIDTIDAYNTFVYNYPLAPQVQEANERAYKMEEEKYTDLGMLGFFNKEEKIEKKARKLLIKAKQIERYPADNGIEDRKSGYLIVANRMYKLLQDKFDDADATLRYLESQEFKDFVKSFRDIMNDIKYTLRKIQENTSSSSRYIKELVDISSRGFADAKADRAMSAYYTKQHREWEKYMHLLDKGYR